MEQDTGLLKSQMIYVSSDGESDGAKNSREDTLYPYAFMEKILLYHASLFIVKLDSGTKMTQVTNIIVK